MVKLRLTTSLVLSSVVDVAFEDGLVMCVTHCDRLAVEIVCPCKAGGSEQMGDFLSSFGISSAFM